MTAEHFEVNPASPLPGTLSPSVPGRDTTPRPDLELVVYGTPGPQGSKSYKGKTKAGRPIMVESSAKVKPWRHTVVLTARDELDRIGLAPLDGPLIAQMVFSFRRPAAHYGTGRNAETVKPSAPARPVGLTNGDLSKLIRATEDALTDAGAWHDDSRVTEYVSTRKVWVNEDPDALPVPGAVIRIWRLPAP